LLDYLEQNVARLKKALIIGSLLPFVFYAIWEMVFIGFIPEIGSHSLFSIAISHNPLVEIKRAMGAQQVPFVVSSNEVFSFCALITSFLGVVLSLGDFLADGFHISKTHRGRLLIALMVFLPPIFFLMILHVDVFVSAIHYAGGVFVAILYCIYPPLMLWRARYVYKYPSPDYIFPGGKLVLSFAFIMGFVVIGLQVGSTLGLLPQVHGVPPMAS
jgi:tyrosine-specific transport protein